jgi:pimeloyl-ACP methyl ester carboxylesterase
MRLALEEYLAFILVFTVVQPFERLFMGADRLRPAGDRPPLLLVHGYECNRGFWWRLRARLEGAGWIVATVNLEPVFAGIDAYADVIARRVLEELARP